MVRLSDHNLHICIGAQVITKEGLVCVWCGLCGQYPSVHAADSGIIYVDTQKY